MRGKRKHLQKFCAALLTILALSGTCGSAALNAAAAEPADHAESTQSQASDTARASYVELLDNKTAGVMTGTPQDTFVHSMFPNAKLEYFNNMADLALSLHMKKVDFVVLPVTSYYSLAEQYPEFGYLDMPIVELDIGDIFPKTDAGDALRAKLNAYIAEIKESGELEELQNYWLYPNDWENIDIPATGENGVLHLATVNTMKPFSFMLNGKNAGFDIAVLAGFGKEYGYGFSIENVDFAGALSGIATNKYDIAAGQISWTQERAESVAFSDSLYTQVIVPIINTDYICTEDTITASDAENGTKQAADIVSATAKDNGNALVTSIRRTLLEQDRWKSVLSGFGVTLLITAAGFALANVLGALFCMMAMSHVKFLRAAARVYSALMQGMPVVVTLMLLYYVVFGHSKASNVAVAILGFGLIFGAYMSQLFESCISGVEQGQREAALASGLTKWQTFCGIVLPQAARRMLPGYFSNLISLMKGTAVVGYIAVTDLTKAGDIIRSSTFEAFVPLAVIAAIYLVMAGLLLLVMHMLQEWLARRAAREKKSRNMLIDGTKRK